MPSVGDKMKNYKKIWGWFIRTWIAISILVIVVALFLLDGQKESEIAGTVSFIMFVISFPTSWLSYAIEISMLDHFAQKQMFIYDNRFVLFLAWAVFFGIGYFQWVILSKVVSAIVRKVKTTKTP